MQAVYKSSHETNAKHIMKIIVFGGNGFIGKSLVSRLISEGHDVKSFDRTHANFIQNVEYIVGNVENVDDINNALVGVNAVIYLISTTNPGTSDLNPEYDISSNLIPYVRLLKAVREFNIGKFIFASSGGTVYGSPEYIPIDEFHTTQPITSYGIVKLAMEKYLLRLKCNGFNPIALRISNPYGPEQLTNTGQGVIGVAIKNAITKGVIEIWGDGQNTRDFLYIDDLVDAFIRSLSYDGEYNVFNIGYGQATTINEIVNIIKEHVDFKVNVKYLNGRECDLKVSVLSSKLAHSELNWYPIVEINDGIRTMLKLCNVL